MVNRTYQPHYSTTAHPRTLRTRAELRNALLALLQKKPLDQIKIGEIAARAGVSRVTFFRHHPTKESLLHDIAAEQVRCLSDLMLPALEASDTYAASMALCAYVDRHRKLWSTLLTGGAAAVLREELLKNAAQIAAGRSDPNNLLPPELAITLNVSGTIEVLTWWLRQKHPLPMERVAEIHARVVITPIIEADTSGFWSAGRKRKKRHAAAQDA